MSWLLDHIPLWVYVTAGLLASGALFYFFSPILIPLWNVTPLWVKELLAAIGAIFAAYIAGRNKGSKNERDRQAQASAEALQRRSEINADVAKVPDADLDKRLGKWMRD